MHGAATMSPLMEQRSEKKLFMCAWCKKNNAETPASGSNFKRVIQLYTQVKMPRGKVTFLRTAPLHIIVSPPISEWGLRPSLPAMAPEMRANPEKMRRKERVVFEFNAADSENLWLHATHLEDVGDRSPGR